MAFSFAKSLDAYPISNIMDFPLDTPTNYIGGVGTQGATKGDLVYLSSGLLRRTQNVATPKAIGIIEGLEFNGLIAQGQPYAAVNTAQTASVTNSTLYPNGMAKVRVESDSIYRVPLKSGQTATNANIGGQYGIAQGASGDQTVDLTQVTNIVVKVVGFSADAKTVFCVLATNTTF